MRARCNYLIIFPSKARQETTIMELHGKITEHLERFGRVAIHAFIEHVQ